jgi:Regulator of chromosome condensation (RCC1) repeat
MLKQWGYPVAIRQRFTVAGLEVLSTGSGHTCSVNPRGVATCWGDNSRGQLGNGTTTGTSQPFAVSGRFLFVSISAGFEHTCGVTTNAQVLCWGDNASGQLGGKISADAEDHSRSPINVSGGLSWPRSRRVQTVIGFVVALLSAVAVCLRIAMDPSIISTSHRTKHIPIHTQRWAPHGGPCTEIAG